MTRQGPLLRHIQHLAFHGRIVKGHSARLAYRIGSGYLRTLVLRRPVLRTVELALLADCNSNCKVCYAADTKRQDETYLSVEEYRRIWREAAALGAFTVTLSGGEPTLREDLFDIISVLEPRHTILALVTNASNLTRSYLTDLKRAGVGTVHFSLDGADEETNDAFRGLPGHYRKVIASIEQAKALGITVCLSTIVKHGGMDKMQEMVQLARAYEIGIVFSPACVSGRSEEDEDILLSAQEWEQVLRTMKVHPRIRTDWTINLSLRQECPGGREKIGISCYGDVVGCGMNPISFGNIRQEPLARIWSRMQHFPDFARRSRECLIAADRAFIAKYIRPLAGLTLPVNIDRHPTSPLSRDNLRSRAR